MTKREEIISSLNACVDVHRSGLWSSGCAFCSYAKQSNPKCFMNLTRDAVALLRDQPDIVRCRECIRRGTYNCPIYVGGDADHGSPDDWYCADGEKAVKQNDR